MGRGNRKKKKKKGKKKQVDPMKRKRSEIAVKDIINFGEWASTTSKSVKSAPVEAEELKSASTDSPGPFSTNLPTANPKIKTEFENGSPFPHVRLENFVTDQIYLREVADELIKASKGKSSAVDFYGKSNDLYEFIQSDDLANCETPCIVKLRDALYSDAFRYFLESITGIKTTSQIDMTASIYKKRGRLLCHDDQLDSRRIAYILYLTPDWKETDGGSLDLFNTDDNGHPRDIVTSLTPKWNSLVFFQVSERSYHQVAEVLQSKNRLTVGGWFHGDPIDFPIPQQVQLKSSNFSECLNSKLKITDWINPKYLVEDSHDQIKDQFMNDGSILLEAFLKPQKYSKLCKALDKRDWQLVGPANRNHYYNTEINDESHDIVEEARELFSCKPFSELLTSWTNLDFTDVSVNVRKFDKTCYTLCSDADQKEQSEGLDCILCCPSTTMSWSTDQGGSVHYLDSEEELLTVDPGINTLSLAYRENGDIMQFVRYMTAEAKSIRYDLKAVFRVEDDEDSEDETNVEMESVDVKNKDN